MTREHKVGIVLSISFLSLVGVVVHSRMREPAAANTEKDSPAQVADLSPTASVSTPTGEPSKDKSDEPTAASPAATPAETSPMPFPPILPVTLNVGDNGDKKEPPAPPGPAVVVADGDKKEPPAGGPVPPAPPEPTPVVAVPVAVPTAPPIVGSLPLASDAKPKVSETPPVPGVDRSSLGLPPVKDKPEVKTPTPAGPPGLEPPSAEPKTTPLLPNPAGKNGDQIAIPSPEKLGVAGVGPKPPELPGVALPANPAGQVPVGVPAAVGSAPRINPAPLGIPLVQEPRPQDVDTRPRLGTGASVTPVPTVAVPKPIETAPMGPPTPPLPVSGPDGIPTNPTGVAPVNPLPATPPARTGDGRASEFIPAPAPPSAVPSNPLPALRPGTGAPEPISLTDPRGRSTGPTPSAGIGSNVGGESPIQGGIRTNPAPIPPPLAAAATMPMAVARTPVAEVESWTEDEHVVQRGETFASISNRKYQTDKYGQALELFNRAHPRVRDELLKSGLVAGLKVAIPPTYLLEKRHAAVIPGLTSTPPGPTPGPVAPAPVPANVPGLVAPSAPPALGPPGAPLPVPLPGPSTSSSAAPATGPITPPSRTARYLVKANPESMREIAGTTMNNRDRWNEIADLNRKIDPAFPVPAGTVLNLPADAKVPAGNTVQ